MEIPQMSQIQLEAIVAAAKCTILVQIMPNKDLDSEKIFAIWSIKSKQISGLEEMGFLKRKNTENDPGFEALKEQYPGREFKLYEPTEIAKQMFNNPLAKDTIN